MGISFLSGEMTMVMCELSQVSAKPRNTESGQSRPRRHHQPPRCDSPEGVVGHYDDGNEGWQQGIFQICGAVPYLAHFHFLSN